MTQYTSSIWKSHHVIHLGQLRSSSYLIQKAEGFYQEIFRDIVFLNQCSHFSTLSVTLSAGQNTDGVSQLIGPADPHHRPDTCWGRKRKFAWSLRGLDMTFLVVQGAELWYTRNVGSARATDLGRRCLYSGKWELILYWFSIDGANNQIQSQGLAEAKVVLERRRGQYEKWIS